VVMDPASGQEQDRTRPHEGSVWKLRFRPDGRQLASASSDGTVVIRAWPSLEPASSPPRTDSDGGVTSLSWSPDGTVLAYGTVDGVGLWSPDHPRDPLPVEAGVESLAWHPEGRELAIGDGEGRIHFWDGAEETPHRSLAAHEGPVEDLVWAPGGAFLVSTGPDGDLKTWQQGRSPGATTMTGQRVGSLGLSHDGSRLVAASEIGVETFDAQLRDSRTVVPVEELWLSADWNPKGLLAITALSGNIGVYDLAAGRSYTLEAGSADDMPRAAFSPDGTLLAVSRAGLVQLYRTEGGRPIGELIRIVERPGLTIFPDSVARTRGFSFGHDPPDRIVWGADGTSLALVFGAEVEVFNALSRRPEWSVGVRGLGTITAAAWDEAGRWLGIVTDTGVLVLVDVERRDVGDYGDRASVADAGLTAIAFRPDSDHVAVATEDGTVIVIDPEGRGPIRRFRSARGRVNGLAWSTDGRWLYSCGVEGEVEVWDVEADRRARENGKQEGHLRAVGVSPDDSLWWSISRSVRVVRTADGRELHLEPFLTGQSADLLAWTSDGRFSSIGAVADRLLLRDETGLHAPAEVGAAPDPHIAEGFLVP